MKPNTRREAFLMKHMGFDVECPEPVTREEMILANAPGGGGSGGSGGGELLATITFTGLYNSSAFSSIGKKTTGVTDKTWSEIVTELGADPNTDETARRKMLDGIRIVCDDRTTVPFQAEYINNFGIRTWLATETGTDDYGHIIQLWSVTFLKSGSAPSIAFMGKIDLDAYSMAE